MIPKNLHQIWLGPKPIPLEYLEWNKKLQLLHPDWTYYFWTDDNIQDFKYKNLLSSCVSESAKSDVIRIEAVHRYGGIYCDMDVEPLRAFDSTLLSNDAFGCWAWPTVIGSGIFGTIPNHPWLNRIIEELPQWASKPDPWSPYLFSQNLMDVTVYPGDFFLEGGKDRFKNTEHSYTIHHWHMSWKN
jgi:mannosyltransferase OCH1-like enzyme